ncbi:hypothetical protein GCM10022421_06240 [Oceanisphaera sediminis]|uniref:Uncharacterized protein n=1 Tax=Oceanisphaera sediminis TaxID=981381 RepID=A0ABP7D8L6_9GAMM
MTPPPSLPLGKTRSRACYPTAKGEGPFGADGKRGADLLPPLNLEFGRITAGCNARGGLGRGCCT